MENQLLKAFALPAAQKCLESEKPKRLISIFLLFFECICSYFHSSEMPFHNSLKGFGSFPISSVIRFCMAKKKFSIASIPPSANSSLPISMNRCFFDWTYEESGF